LNEGGLIMQRRKNSGPRNGKQKPEKETRSETDKSNYSKGKRSFSSDSVAGKKYAPKSGAPKQKASTLEDGIRINRYIANAGICSRREAESYILAGVISINGKVTTDLSTKVKYGDIVKFNDAPLAPEKKTYVLLNKPKGYVTTFDDPKSRKTVIDLVQSKCRERIFPVGKLDIDTTGVLLLTNDGELTEKLTNQKNNKKKIYQVTLDKTVKEDDLQKLLNGIELEDGAVKATTIAYTDPENLREVGIELYSSKNHIVRRMFEHIGYNVMKLDCVYFAGLTKKDLPRGKCRFLSEKEITMLKRGLYS